MNPVAGSTVFGDGNLGIRIDIRDQQGIVDKPGEIFSRVGRISDDIVAANTLST